MKRNGTASSVARSILRELNTPVAPGSRGALLRPSPLRTARESFVLMQLKPF